MHVPFSTEKESRILRTQMISGLRLRNLKVIVESENDKVIKICRNIEDSWRSGHWPNMGQLRDSHE